MTCTIPRSNVLGVDIGQSRDEAIGDEAIGDEAWRKQFFKKQEITILWLVSVPEFVDCLLFGVEIGVVGILLIGSGLLWSRWRLPVVVCKGSVG